MALERVPADIRKEGGVARMSDPKVCFTFRLFSIEDQPIQVIKEIMRAVTIPVMAKCRIGHFAEAQILEALGVDCVFFSPFLVSPSSSLFSVFLTIQTSTSQRC